MKPNISIFVILLFILQSNLTIAQNSFEIEGNYSITSEKFIPTNNANDIFESKLYHSFGINGRMIFKSKFFVIGGLHLKRFGTKFDVEETTIQNPEGTGEFYEVNWNANSIDIPIKLGYYFISRDKFRFGIALGISNSFVIDQTQKARGEDIEIETYEDYIFNLNSNLEIGYSISENFTVNLIPIWQRQINSNFGNYKQRSYGCQIGISYKLKK